MKEELEILDLDGLDFEEVEKIGHGERYTFPVVTFGTMHIHFNKAFVKHLKGAVGMKYKYTTDYIVLQPQKELGDNVFMIYLTGHGRSYATAVPANLREKKIKRGTYKIYRFKDGYAIKRYEPIETYGE